MNNDNTSKSTYDDYAFGHSLIGAHAVCTNHYTCISKEHNPTCPAKLNQQTAVFNDRMPEVGEL